MSDGKILNLTAAAMIDLTAAEPDAPPKRPTFRIDAYSGGAIRVGGFYRPVVIDLAGLRANRTVPILLDHDTTQIVGQAADVEITRNSVKLSGIITGDDAPAQKVISHARNGFRWSASVGVGVDKFETVPEGKTTMVNGQEFAGPLLVARAGRLGEVSLVAVGADETASATIAASAGKIEVDAMDEIKDIMRNEEDSPRSVAAALEAAKERQKRERKIAEITASALAERPDDVDLIESLAQRAMQADMTPERYELELLRALRPRVSAMRSDRRDACAQEVIEAALCITGGLRDIEKHYQAATLDEASKRWRRGLSLGELLLTFAHRNGYAGLSTSDPKGLLRAAFDTTQRRDIRAAGVSTYDISDILANVANKFLVQGFSAVESAWRQIAAIRSVRDFKEAKSYALTGGFEYDEVPPGGELKHATASETAYTNQAKTYGRMFAIDRRDIINDDLGALTQVPMRIGRGAALKLNTVFWTAFMDNSSFFTSVRGNYKDGAATALSATSIDAAVTAFKKLTDPDGYPTGVMPRILLVPVDLEATALRLLNSMELRELGSTDKTYGTANIWVGRFQPVATTYLSNASISGNSAAAWYLLADPNDLPVIEVAFLNGKDMPTVESADADFNVLGIQMRGYHDFGVAKQEYRGGVKMKGTA